MQHKQGCDVATFPVDSHILSDSLTVGAMHLTARLITGPLQCSQACAHLCPRLVASKRAEEAAEMRGVFLLGNEEDAKAGFPDSLRQQMRPIA